MRQNWPLVKQQSEAVSSKHQQGKDFIGAEHGVTDNIVTHMDGRGVQIGMAPCAQIQLRVHFDQFLLYVLLFHIRGLESVFSLLLAALLAARCRCLIGL